MLPRSTAASIKLVVATLAFVHGRLAKFVSARAMADPSPTPLEVASARQIARSPRVLRTHLHAYAHRIYVAAFRASFGLCRYMPAHPNASPLSASCSLRQRFAFGFLQIRSRPRYPCRSASSSPCRVSRGLTPPRTCALPGAHSKKPRTSGASFAESSPGRSQRPSYEWRALRRVIQKPASADPSSASEPGSGTPVGGGVVPFELMSTDMLSRPQLSSVMSCSWE